MSKVATIVAGGGAVSCTNALKGVLRFFGVEAHVSAPDQFVAGVLEEEPRSGKTRVLCPASTLLDVLKRVAHSPTEATYWRMNVHSVFVYADKDSAAFEELQKQLVSYEHVPLVRFDHGLYQWVISDTWPEFCGPMSGLRIHAAQGRAQEASSLQDTDECDIVFLKGVYDTVPIFLLASDTVVDVDAPLGDRNFDIRDSFLSAAPIVMYVKWAFGTMCWHIDETEACVVIDDPLLRPTYGFLNYHSLLSVMDRHNFTTNVAFIPWNWRRCENSVVELFRNRSERYSISIHGCDHTGGEFGTQNVGTLAWKSRQAVDRMTRMDAAWGLTHDRVMVFPQGVFSSASMTALKKARYLAAVNTEVFPHGAPQVPIAVSDVWDVAVMRYESFPLFTRRYPSQGVENFAFDILLGKPCIVVGHHDICRNGQAPLIEIVQQLNALNCRLSWRSLGDVVRRSYRKKERAAGIVDVEMYGSELHLKNRSSHPQSYCIAKRESDETAIKEVCADSRPIAWEFSNGQLTFEQRLNPGESAFVSLVGHEDGAQMEYQEEVMYKLKVMLRRHLSEMRDKYVAVWRT